MAIYGQPVFFTTGGKKYGRAVRTPSEKPNGLRSRRDALVWMISHRDLSDLLPHPHMGIVHVGTHMPV